MLKKHFFNLCIDDMAAYDRIKLLCVKKYLLCTLSRSRLVQTRHYRSSLSQMFFQIDLLKNFANFTGKHQCWSLASSFIKNSLRTPFFYRSFSLSLHWLPYIMLNLITKSSFDISLLFKLQYAAILLIVNCK